MLRVLIALFSMNNAYTIQVIYFRAVRLIRLFRVQLEKSTFLLDRKIFLSLSLSLKYIYRLIIKHLFLKNQVMYISSVLQMRSDMTPSHLLYFLCIYRWALFYVMK